MVMIPSILTDDLAEAQQQLRLLEKRVGRVHIDFADDTLVPNQTILPADLIDLRTRVELDAHLMVDRPTTYFGSLAHIGFRRVTVHLGILEELPTVIDQAAASGFEIGIALNPGSSAQDLEPYGDEIDFIHIMAVEPGFGGQDFITETTDLIADVKEHYPHLPLAVDGGVRLSNASRLVELGADWLIVGRGGYEDKLDQWAGLKI